MASSTLVEAERIARLEEMVGLLVEHLYTRPSDEQEERLLRLLDDLHEQAVACEAVA